MYLIDLQREKVNFLINFLRGFGMILLEFRYMVKMKVETKANYGFWIS